MKEGLLNIDENNNKYSEVSFQDILNVEELKKIKNFIIELVVLHVELL